MKNQTTETPRVEEGKVFAERLNGLAASVGCLALIHLLGYFPVASFFVHHTNPGMI